MLSEHLPNCRSIPMNQVLAERGQEPMGRYEGMAIQKCADGCPVLERTLEHARQIAREQGWLTQSGFIWDG